MADWKTYVKAARNTARKQAPEARESASRASKRAGDYVRAAGNAVEETRRDDARGADRRDDERSSERGENEREGDRDEDDHRSERREEPPTEDDRSPRARPADDLEDPEVRPAKQPSPARTGVDTARLRKDAAAYASVAQRRLRGANLGTRILRALRDALLIGGSLLVIWLVLYAAGIPIPFTTVLIAVAVIVVIAFGGTLYSQFRRRRQAEQDPEPEADLDPGAGRD